MHIRCVSRKWLVLQVGQPRKEPFGLELFPRHGEAQVVAPRPVDVEESLPDPLLAQPEASDQGQRPVVVDPDVDLDPVQAVPILARVASLLAHLAEERERPTGLRLAAAAEEAVEYEPDARA